MRHLNSFFLVEKVAQPVDIKMVNWSSFTLNNYYCLIHFKQEALWHQYHHKTSDLF